MRVRNGIGMCLDVGNERGKGCDSATISKIRRHNF